MIALTFELSRTPCGEALHVCCACCHTPCCVAAVGASFSEAAIGPAWSFITTGRAAGLSDDEAIAAALDALAVALDGGGVAELAPDEVRQVNGADLYRHVLACLGGIDRNDPATREHLRADTVAALAEARLRESECVPAGERG